MSEHDLQAALVEWASWKKSEIPALKWLFAVANGGLRNKVVAGKLKKEGVKAGVSDLFLAIARGGYHGMWIEMKYGSGKPTEKQWEFLNGMSVEGYYCIIAWNWEQAALDILKYLNGGYVRRS